MKRRIRLSERDLHRVVKESVNKVLRKMDEDTIADQNQEPMYKEGDIVYWMYYYSSVFPVFYKVVKVGPKSIWISQMGSIDENVTMGYGSWTRVPNENNISDKVRRISLRSDGVAYVTYYGHRMALNVWNGKPISCQSD